MLKRSILITFVALATLFTASATSPKLKLDLNRIKFDVAANPSRYQSLMSRFLIGDSTLTMDEMADVYYGYAFTFDYDPTERHDDIDRAYESLDYQKTWDLCEKALKINPVSLDLTIKALVAATNGSDDHARSLIPTLQNRYDLISTVILSSGLGTTTESPFIVICDEDLNRIVRNVICVESTIGRATIRDLDAIKVKLPSNDRQHILYFNNTIQKEFERNKR